MQGFVTAIYEIGERHPLLCNFNRQSCSYTVTPRVLVWCDFHLDIWRYPW